jgi:hypothetical protein
MMSTLDTLYDALTKKAQTANEQITREIVEDWVGNIGYKDKQIAFMSVALSELHSGDYTPEEMVGDMLHLSDRDN